MRSRGFLLSAPWIPEEGKGRSASGPLHHGSDLGDVPPPAPRSPARCIHSVSSTHPEAPEVWSPRTLPRTGGALLPSTPDPAALEDDKEQRVEWQEGWLSTRSSHRAWLQRRAWTEPPAGARGPGLNARCGRSHGLCSHLRCQGPFQVRPRVEQRKTPLMPRLPAVGGACPHLRDARRPARGPPRRSAESEGQQRSGE